jgi:pimeloyl-ACP methyl ester carboxylesterase
MSLLAYGKYLKIDAGHVVHLDQPERFVEILDGFFPTQDR